MLKWVLILAAIVIVLAILGFVIHVAVAVTKVLFFVFLAAFLISLYAHWRQRGSTKP